MSNGLSNPKPWGLGSGYEQGDPGWYVYSEANHLVVFVIDDEIPLSREEAEAILGVLNAHL